MSGEYEVVAAIDLGTTFSGYAFSFKEGHKYIFVNWGSAYGIPHSYKTPTCVLTDADNHFKSMGYEALHHYTNKKREEATSHKFYKGFKMSLHTPEKLTLNYTIKDTMDRNYSALDIFGNCLFYLKSKLLEELRNRMPDGIPRDEKIRWILTVPAIWSDTAKHFMRHAAVKGGLVDTISADNLRLALEPEVASLYCQEPSGGSDDIWESVRPQVKLSIGEEWVVLDAGGGTLDMTAHKKLSDGTLAELHHANGGPHGGQQVNDNFFTFLDELFEHKFVEKYKSLFPGGFEQFTSNIEMKKRSIGPKDEGMTNFPLPYGMIKVYEEIGNSMEKELRSEFKTKGVTLCDGELNIPNTLMKELFQPMIKNIVSCLRDMLAKPALNKVSTILMVGGFSDSPLLQHVIQENFEPPYKVFIPRDAVSSVLRGAVLFGHRPQSLSVRRAKLTYGTAVHERFDPTKHDSARKEVVEGIEYAKDCFDVLVKRGSEVRYNSVVKRRRVPIHSNQTKVDFNILSTLNENSRYSDEPGVEVLGSLSLPLPGSGLDRSVTVSFNFGDPEIHVTARDERPGGGEERTEINFSTT